MAMACLRLFTVPPLPPLPDLRVPRFFLRIALSTDLPAALPYFRPPDFLLERFLVAICFFLSCELVGKHMRKGCLLCLLAATSFVMRHQSQVSLGRKISRAEA